MIDIHSRPQRPRSFWSAPRIATSGLHSGQMSAHAQAARARVGMDCTISIETSSDKMAADLNFAVCVSFREDKPKTKQLRFLL